MKLIYARNEPKSLAQEFRNSEYSYEDFKYFSIHSIFLAGPTSRSLEVLSWRPALIDILKRLNYHGIVYIPEPPPGVSFGEEDFVYADQIEWELKYLHKAKKILFWIPRNLETLPGFTTNVEFGLFIKSNPEKVVLGYPLDGNGNPPPKLKYLKHLYAKYAGKDPVTDLEEAVKECLQSLNLKKN